MSDDKMTIAEAAVEAEAARDAELVREREAEHGRMLRVAVTNGAMALATVLAAVEQVDRAALLQASRALRALGEDGRDFVAACDALEVVAQCGANGVALAKRILESPKDPSRERDPFGR